MLKHIRDLLPRAKPCGVVLPPLEADCDTAETAGLIGSAILASRPFLASRLGWMECQALGYDTCGNVRRDFLKKLWKHAGVFPATKPNFSEFCAAYRDALGQVDLLGLMKAPDERMLVEACCPNARRCELGALEPYFSDDPWSRHLAGLRVCVVHPFSASIEAQYATVRERLFPGTKILPEFSLRVVKPPQTISGNTDGFANWTSALDHLTSEVTREVSDVTILGCGAYGMPLGARLKAAGRTVIHLGGATQMLFGVSGARWRESPAFADIINESWKAPMESERPPGWERVESGCYW